MKLASWTPDYWTKEQKEVWDTVEAHWRALIGGKIDEFLEFIHPEFVGYGHESPLPVDKPWLEKWVGFWAKSTTIVICELRPVHLRIHKDIAIVQFCIFTIEQNKSGAKRVIRRYTMTWKKELKHWVVIGSHNNLMDETIRG